jgi:hypothetical protein
MNEVMNRKVYGDGYTTCKWTGLPLEVGQGALSVDAQAVGNLGKLEYDQAELTNRRKDQAAKLASEQAALANMQVAHFSLKADDITGRQNSLYRVAAQEQNVKSLLGQREALKAQHEAAAVKIAEVKAMLKEEGVLDEVGEGPANVWRGMILQKGWSLPT